MLFYYLTHTGPIGPLKINCHGRFDFLCIHTSIILFKWVIFPPSEKNCSHYSCDFSYDSYPIKKLCLKVYIIIMISVNMFIIRNINLFTR